MRPRETRKPFSSNAKAAQASSSPWARPEDGKRVAIHWPAPTPAPRREEPALVPAPPSYHHAILLIAFLPSFAAGMLNQHYLEPAFRISPALFFLADAVQWIVIPLLVWFLVLRPANIRPRDLGLRLPVLGTRPFESLVLFLFVAFLLWASYAATEAIALRFFSREAGLFGYGAAIPKTFPWNALVVVYLSITAAVVEEVVFRSLTWNYFSRLLPAQWLPLCYVIGSAILFAATHSEQGPHGMIAATVYGMVAAALYLRLKDLWPLVFAHFMVDIISFWPK